MKKIKNNTNININYVKGTPYFCQNKKAKTYPLLNNNIDTDILIIGGGIVGAITNFYLSKKYDVTLVDKSRFGYCCTSCATVLLEYQLDDYAENLEKIMSEQEIVDVYKMGLGCIDKIEKFIKEFGNKCEFSKRPSFLYTNKKGGIEAIKKEYLFRIKHELDAKFISQTSNPFPFPIKAGLYCKNGGAEFNPYLFAVQMLENSKNQDKMFENTEIISIIEKNDSFIAITNLNQKINCKKIIFATGYNFELLTDIKLCERTISYSIVTNPLQIELPNNCLIQDDEIPYHYLRLLPDNRIIFGGEDTVYKTKINQKLAEKKYEKLLKDLKKIFNFKDSEIKIDYKFCGAFGQTENNLGLIGQTENPNIYLMISSGANGVINAMYGVEILDGLINNKPKPLSHLFSPLR